MALGTGSAKGVDADIADCFTEETLDKAVAFAKSFSEKTGSVIAITGKTDIVADKDRAFVIRNGNDMMSLVTGTGCQLSSLTAAYIAANQNDILTAAASAVSAMGLAGETAFGRLSPLDGNASYRNYIIDAVCNMTPQGLKEGAKYEMR